MHEELTPRIWAYWEDLPGRRRSSYLDLCLETVRRHAGGTPLQLLDRGSVLEWLPDLDQRVWERLPAPYLRADYARSRLLHRYGGLWTDVDVIAVAPLGKLLGALDEAEMAGWGREFGRFFIGLCAARPGGVFTADWIDGQDATLATNDDWDRLPYRALGQDVVWGLAQRHAWSSWPAGQVAPVPWYQWRRFFSRVESPTRLLAARTATVVLWNASMGPRLEGARRSDLLEGSTLLSRLLRIGLGLTDAAEEERLWTHLHRLSDLRFTRAGQSVEVNLRRAWSRGDATRAG